MLVNVYLCIQFPNRWSLFRSAASSASMRSRSCYSFSYLIFFVTTTTFFFFLIDTMTFNKDEFSSCEAIPFVLSIVFVISVVSSSSSFEDSSTNLSRDKFWICEIHSFIVTSCSGFAAASFLHLETIPEVNRECASLSFESACLYDLIRCDWLERVLVETEQSETVNVIIPLRWTCGTDSMTYLGN